MSLFESNRVEWLEQLSSFVRNVRNVFTCANSHLSCHVAPGLRVSFACVRVSGHAKVDYTLLFSLLRVF